MLKGPENSFSERFVLKLELPRQEPDVIEVVHASGLASKIGNSPLSGARYTMSPKPMTNGRCYSGGIQGPEKAPTVSG